jgi:hypothetical protein
MPALRLVRVNQRVRLSELRRHLVPAGQGTRSSTVDVGLDRARAVA